MAGEYEDDGEGGSSYARLEAARARHEIVKIAEREFNLAVKRGEYLPRASYQQASATLLAVLAQGARSIPDNLERKLGLAPEVVAAIAAEIDANLAAISLGLKKLHDG